MSLKIENFEIFWKFVRLLIKKLFGKNTWVGMGYPGLKVQGDLKILKGLK